MNHDDQPFGEDTDLAVIALVDGTLDDFAAARDTDAAAVRSRLEAWPGLSGRVTTVLAARRGTDAASPRRRSRVVLAVAAGVGVLAVLIGGGLWAQRDDGTPARTTRHGMGPHVMDAYIGGIGEIGEPQQLSAAIARRGPVDVGLGTGATSTTVLGGSGLPIAAERCVRVSMPGRDVSLVATGQFRGLGAAIWVTRAGGADVAFVSALDSCDILYSLRLG
ncbi:MAG: hypothetical protein ACKO2C_09555 [Actinomycetes bacterium]